MAIIQDFVNWSANAPKVKSQYVKPTSNSLYQVVSSNLIELTELNLWNNLVNGDLIVLETTEQFPTGLENITFYVNKNIAPRLSLHNSKPDAINNINPISISSSGLGIQTLKFNWDIVFKVNEKGVTGTIEPIWNREIYSFTEDGTVIWKTFNTLNSIYEPIEFLPFERRKEDAFIKISELLKHGLALANEESKPLLNKYKDYNNLPQEFIIKILEEFGYKYLAEASILDTKKTANLINYLKVLNYLKGTRKGLRLALNLLGYEYTEQLWYEKTPIGEPNTFDLNLITDISNVNVKTVESLNKFLRSYVYAIPNIVTDIKPFSFVTGIAGGGGVGDQIHDFIMDFEIPLTPKQTLFEFEYTDGYGTIINDSSGLDNHGYIVLTNNDPDAVFRFLFETQSNPVLDFTSNNNNLNIISSIAPNNLLFGFSYTEGTGININDDSINDNNSTIESFVPEFRLFDFSYTEGTGITLNDNSQNNNDAEIVTNIEDTQSLFEFKYIEGTGTTLNDSSTKNNDANILTTSDIPAPNNLIAWYKLNNDVLDYSGNNNHATQFGGSFDGLSLDLGNTDYISIPYTVLNGKNDFSYGGWFDLDVINSNVNTLLSVASSSFPDSELILIYDTNTKGFTGYKNNQYFSFANKIPSIDYDGQSDFESLYHHVVWTRTGNMISLYIDSELRSIATFYNGSISVSSTGLIIGQEQDSIGGSFDPNQSLNGKIDNIFFYDICLTSDQVKKWYQKSR